jgi:hypothetical protein
MYCRGWVESCNMNNHGAPYHLMVPPPLDGQAPTLSPVLFRLRRDEAIVVVGPTPPACRYYSYTLYLYNRWDPRQERVRKVFDTFGQSTNQLLLKTGGSAFGKNVVLTFTCDRKVDRDVRDYEFIDNPCCGALEPKEGLVAADGSINFSFTPNRPGWFYVTVTVSDEKDRQTCGEIEIASSGPWSFNRHVSWPDRRRAQRWIRSRRGLCAERTISI